MLPIAFHIVSNFGWMYFAPGATTLMMTRAPATTRGTMLGVNLLSVTAGSLISGRLGSLYEQVSARDFWLIHAAIVGGAGLVLLLLAKPLGQRLTEIVDAAPEPEPLDGAAPRPAYNT